MAIGKVEVVHFGTDTPSGPVEFCRGHRIASRAVEDQEIGALYGRRAKQIQQRDG
jgi:hypothetical protein